ncbi:uncharacterized protein DUF4440 [Novosphingobium sp. PhB57]|uniref:nuclear transport factor 2 family protein n=1 Tax=Novosphingobium sp. PhB57 TaxID=2485107 RepID=UPI00104E5612|nr:nuclear transport factor 2 family protein [Novosphingobium sp. PhB57]TCU51423.1 uncharacterized protein DUF4440 [Novosphingobium sp. PhB57]
MDDERIWKFEAQLWTGSTETYAELIDDEAILVVPSPPFIHIGRQAVEAMAQTPRWSAVEFSEKHVARPEEGLIVIGYKAKAVRSDGDDYEANCSSTLRRLGHEQWRVVQHQQTPPLIASA